MAGIYSSIYKLDLQLFWYVILSFTVYNLWFTFETNTFDEYLSMAVMGAFIMIIWFVIQLFTLNRNIRKYNSDVANFFYVTIEERAEACIE